MQPLAVVDHGTGNMASLMNAIRTIGVAAERLEQPPGRDSAWGGVILPGVGAFPNAVASLRRLGWDTWLGEWAESGRPLLGICLGMQLLFDSSTEMGGEVGLGLIPGRVERLDAAGERLPHIGWSGVRWVRPNPLSVDLGEQCAMYHVHSYACIPSRGSDVLARSFHGSEFTTAAGSGRVFGVQFHPEKSSDEGLRLLLSFARLCWGLQ